MVNLKGDIKNYLGRMAIFTAMAGSLSNEGIMGVHNRYEEG